MTSTTAIKRFAYAIDLICMLLSLVLIAFGCYMLLAYDINEIASMSAYAYIVIGVSSIVIFILGSLAASKEHVCCTVTFIVILYIVILVQIGITFFLTHGDTTVASNLANSLDNTWEEELVSPGAMSLYENWFECCGRASPQDYIVNERLPPATCFHNKELNNADMLIETGCRISFENYWIKLLGIFNILAWVLICIEFLGSIIACCLCNNIRNEVRRSHY